LARPFFLYQLRKHYLIVGKSDHRRIHQQMVRAVERSFRARGDGTTRFYLSFLDDEPRPDAAVIQALNEGASRIVVAEVFLTISNHTAEGKDLIEALQVEDIYGVPVSYTGPLYDSEPLKQMFVERANAARGDTPRDRVGVLLVGHGQPDEWDVGWPTETAQEIGFRQDVLAHLEADGYRREHLDLAWMEFKQPRPAQAVERFLANGADQVLYFAAAISADAIHSQYDIPALVNRAKTPEGASLINLGAWNDHPLAIEAIRRKIDSQLDGRAVHAQAAAVHSAP
jgi:sirohydrochlorin ferrochelatase